MYQLVVLAHILAAFVWVGGLLFLALVVVPVARRLPPGQRGPLFAALGRRFRLVGWLALGVLLVTGLFAATYHGMTWGRLASGAFFADRFGQVLTVKVAVVLLMLVVSAWHDFILGPASTRAADQPVAEALRRRSSWAARLTLLLALAVVALAVVLVRGVPWS